MGCMKSKQKKAPLKIKKGFYKGNDKQNEIKQIKFVLLGDQAVGKSSILNRFVNNKYDDAYQPTIHGAFVKKDIILNNKSYKPISVNVWDTAGQERFRSLLPSFYRDAQVALLVYDITSRESLDNLEFWLTELQEKVEKENMIIVLACNKIDVDEKQWQVSFNMGQKFAEYNNIPFNKISALTGEGVQEMFINSVQLYLDKQINN